MRNAWKDPELQEKVLDKTLLLLPDHLSKTFNFYSPSWIPQDLVVGEVLLDAHGEGSLHQLYDFAHPEEFSNASEAKSPLASRLSQVRLASDAEKNMEVEQ